jgi:hypothetical protein
MWPITRHVNIRIQVYWCSRDTHRLPVYGENLGESRTTRKAALNQSHSQCFRPITALTRLKFTDNKTMHALEALHPADVFWLCLILRSVGAICSWVLVNSLKTPFHLHNVKEFCSAREKSLLFCFWVLHFTCIKQNRNVQPTNEVHFNIYAVFYSLYSQQHVSAVTAAIFRVIL